MADLKDQIEDLFARRSELDPRDGDARAVVDAAIDLLDKGEARVAEYGPDGEVITFKLSQGGTRLTGTFQVDVPYTATSGARQKETLRGTIEGTASGNRATGTFREGSDKGATGTFEFTMASGGNVFTAAVRSEDTSDTYTVRRSAL